MSSFFSSSPKNVNDAADKLNALKAEINTIGPSDEEFKNQIIKACPELVPYTPTINNRFQLLVMYAKQKETNECKKQEGGKRKTKKSKKSTKKTRKSRK